MTSSGRPITPQVRLAAPPSPTPRAPHCTTVPHGPASSSSPFPRRCELLLAATPSPVGPQAPPHRVVFLRGPANSPRPRELLLPFVASPRRPPPRPHVRRRAALPAPNSICDGPPRRPWYPFPLSPFPLSHSPSSLTAAQVVGHRWSRAGGEGDRWGGGELARENRWREEKEGCCGPASSDPNGLISPTLKKDGSPYKWSSLMGGEISPRGSSSFSKQLFLYNDLLTGGIPDISV